MENKTEVALPNLNITTSQPVDIKEPEVVKLEKVVKIYDETLEDIRTDRKEIDEVMKTLIDMVVNTGDSSSSSKEAMVNLMRLKSETSDRKTKVLDLLMRAYMKERDTSPKYFAVTQNNTKITNSAKRDFLRSISEEEIAHKKAT